MSMDWYKKKFGGTTPTVSVSTPMPRPVAQATQQYSAGTSVGTTFQQPPPMASAEAPTTFSDLLAQGSAEFWDKHSEHKRKGEQYSCPRCGSNNFFTRSFAKVMGPGGLASPAPICEQCGYNGLYEQTGSK